jgi:hypothetical protein
MPSARHNVVCAAQAAILCHAASRGDPPSQTLLGRGPPRGDDAHLSRNSREFRWTLDQKLFSSRSI